MNKTTLKFKVPGKVVINGGYIVCHGEPSIVINLDSYLHVTAKKQTTKTIQIEKDGEKFNFSATKNYLNKENDFSYFNNIIFVVLEHFKLELDFGLEIEMRFDSGFTTNNGQKTGIGSSACILVAIVKVFCYFCLPEYDLTKVCLAINKVIAPKASGVDVAACSTGNLIYSKQLFKPLAMPKNILVLLGSRGKSTNTREMLKFINKVEMFESLKKENKNIISLVEKNGFKGLCELKKCYHDYLLALKATSGLIVPQYQFEVLLQTNNENVICCGVSGSGGEDCIWCLVMENEANLIIEIWRNKFEYVGIHNLLELGGIVGFDD